MSRPSWVGSLSFGLVHVPVRLYSAVSPRQVHFHLLHDADGARIQQKRVCSEDGQEVAYEHVVKGYELAPGRYVEVTRGELEAFDPRSSRAIELEEFVRLEDIDPLFFQGSYHLVPDRDAERPYALVVEALRQSGRVGLGRLVMHHRGHLCVVRPLGRGLALSTLHYADELVAQDSLAELDLAGALPQEHELQMALRLVEARAASFEPRRYPDVHRERLLSFLERRARAQARLPEAPPAGQRAQAPEREELLRTLEQSIAALGPRRPTPAPPPSEGELRLRQQAARTARPASPRTRRKRGPGEEPESS